MIDAIELPLIAITVRPPWGQCIVYFGKDVENRGHTILHEIGQYRGPILLTQSGWTKPQEEEARAAWDVLAEEKYVPMLPMPLEVRTWGGTAFAVADLDTVIRPDQRTFSKWRIPGSVGLVLKNVRQIKRVPASGGVGAWKTRWCRQCGRISSSMWTPPAKHPCEGCRPWNRLADGGKLNLLGRHDYGFG
jgi:hypothetical protein